MGEEIEPSHRTVFTVSFIVGMTALDDLSRVTHDATRREEEFPLDGAVVSLKSPQVAIDVALLTAALQRPPFREDVVAIAGLVLNSQISC